MASRRVSRTPTPWLQWRTEKWLKQRKQSERTASGRRLVIVESPAKAKTIAGLPRQGLHGRVVDRPHPRPAAQRRRGAGRAQAGAVGAPRRRTSTTTSSRSTSSTRRRRTVVSDLQREARRRPTSSCSRRTKTARARRSPGTSSRCCKPKVPVRRMVFHEITKPAIEQALEQTREIDDRLVDAQETRRILDRLYGYEVSPVLWRKVMKGLSAGRVQSVATRLVVERERERIEFRAAEYWDIVATFDPGRVRRAPRRGRRPPGRAGPRLRPQRRARRTPTRSSSTRRRPRAPRRRARGRRRSRCARSSASRTRAARPRRS